MERLIRPTRTPVHHSLAREVSWIMRDIQDLMKKDILQKEASGGRSTNYELK